MNTEANILLSKWLEGSISPEELKQLETEVDLVALKAILDQQKAFDLEVRDPESMWENFSSRIIVEPDIDTNPTPPSPKLFPRRGFLVAASIALLVVVGFFTYQFSTAPQLATTVKEFKNAQLSDGTLVKLSPSTSVYFDEKNWDTAREIDLKGQAYFEVSKGVPFSVKTSGGLVKVLGTAFDIWSAGDYMRVQCFEGKVEVSHTKIIKSVYLTVGQEVWLNKTSIGTVEDVNTNQPDWLAKNELNYKHIPVHVVISDIERFLDLNVEISGLDLNSVFSGRIPFNNPEETSRYLAEPMGWKYSINSETIQFFK